MKVAATAKHFSNYGIENYGNFVSATADPVNGLPHNVPDFPPLAQGWKSADNQAAYCTDSSAESAGGGYCQYLLRGECMQNSGPESDCANSGFL